MLVLPAVVLAIAGCGSSGSSSSSSSSSSSPSSSSSSSAAAPATSSSSSATSSASSSAAPAGGGQTLSIAANPTGQLKYTKSSLAAKAGRVTITMANMSSVPHNINIQQGTSGKVLGATPTFTGGSRSVSLTLKPGKYTYFCSVPGHRQAGMLGTLTVK